MHSSRICASGSDVEIRLRPGRHAAYWQALAIVLGLACIVLAGLPGPVLVVAWVALWGLARAPSRAGGRPERIRLTPETGVVVRADGRHVPLPQPLRGWLLPGCVTLALGRWSRLQVFSDQCSAADFRALRRRVSGAGR